jgi:hypothetical protein
VQCQGLVNVAEVLRFTELLVVTSIIQVEIINCYSVLLTVSKNMAASIIRGKINSRKMCM